MDRLTGWGPPGRNTQKEAMAEMGVLEAMAGGPLGPANPAGVLLSPQKIHGVVYGEFCRAQDRQNHS